MTSVATIEEVKKWVNATGSGDDARLVSLQERMAYIFAQAAGVNLDNPTSDTVTYNGSGSAVQYLRPDTQSITAVETRDTFSGDWDNLVTTFSDIEFSVQGPKMTRLDGGVFPRGRMNIRVTGMLGFTDIPPDIVQAVLEMIESSFHRRQVTTPTIRSSEAPNAQDLKDFSDNVKRTIARYRFGVGY